MINFCEYGSPNPLFHRSDGNRLQKKGSFPRVRLFSPKEGVFWYTGETRTIFWRIAYVPPPPIPPTVNITLRRKGNDSFRFPLTTFFPTETGQFKWKIPDQLENHDDYYVRILPNRPLPGKPNIMASKSKPFTIVKNVNTRKYIGWR